MLTAERILVGINNVCKSFGPYTYGPIIKSAVE